MLMAGSGSATGTVTFEGPGGSRRTLETFSGPSTVRTGGTRRYAWMPTTSDDRSPPPPWHGMEPWHFDSGFNDRIAQRHGPEGTESAWPGTYPRPTRARPSRSTIIEYESTHAPIREDEPRLLVSNNDMSVKLFAIRNATSQTQAVPPLRWGEIQNKAPRKKLANIGGTKFDTAVNHGESIPARQRGVTSSLLTLQSVTAFPCSLGIARRDHHAGSRRHERRVPIRNPRRWPRVQQDCEVRRVPRCRIFDILECGWKKVRCRQSGWAGDRVGPSVRFLRTEPAKSLALTRAPFVATISSSHPLAKLYTSRTSSRSTWYSPDNLYWGNASEPDSPTPYVSPTTTRPPGRFGGSSGSHTPGRRDPARVVKFSPAGSGRELLVFSEVSRHRSANSETTMLTCDYGPIIGDGSYSHR
jgi:hypothetical protein